MQFPLFYLLIIYLFFLAVWLIFSLIAVYHMIRFGFLNFTTFFVTFFYIAVAAIMLNASYNYLIPIDWSVNVSMFQSFFNNFSSF
ncbi:MAG: hypothetical protein V1651_02265 [Patescibacteria group bacterium]